MKKLCIFLSYLIFLNHTIFSIELYPKARLMVDFWSSPFFYESTNNMYGTSLNGSIMAGVRLNKFTIGAEVFENYFSLTAQEDENNLTGAWNIVRGTINGYYEPINWYELKWGIGGAWQSSSFTNDSVGTVGKDEGGVSFLLESTFRPAKFVELTLINRLDLFINDESAIPYFYGGLRCDFHPGLDWINLYVEVAGMPLNYNETPGEINSGLFVWTVGTSIDITFMDSFDKTKKEAQNIKKSRKNKIDKKYNNKNIEKLKTAKKGDIIIFSNIIFYSDSDMIKEKSLEVIYAMTEVLLERKDINIEIRGHTNYTGNAVEEVELSKKRAIMVKNYLEKGGVNPKRMKCYGYGGLYSSNKIIDDSNRRVEIKISERELF